MTLPAFQSHWRKRTQIKPRICLLEVREQDLKDGDPKGDPIARLFVERDEEHKIDHSNGEIYEASITLHYQTVDVSLAWRAPEGGEFEATYSRGYGGQPAEVALVRSALSLDPSDLRGKRVGTYLMNEIVTWAKQWPEASVRPINLREEQAYDQNRERRNRFYEQFGIEFDWTGPVRRAGVAKPMLARDLNLVTSWSRNVTELDVREAFSELLQANWQLSMDLSSRKGVIKELAASLQEANDRPLHWALQRLWWRLPALAALFTLGILAWLAWQPK
jgi:GNAT superfamily N-acetyltransferase